MSKQSRLSFVLVIVLLFVFVMPTMSYAEIIPPGSTLSGNFSATVCGDDYFNVFLSTTSNLPAYATPTYTSTPYWNDIESFSVNLNAVPQKYYILVSCTNTSGPGGFIGKFTLNGSGYKFANGSTTLYTDTVNWKVSKTGFIDGTYTNPVLAFDYKNYLYDGIRYNLDPNAQWIWTEDGLDGYATRYFIAEIIPVDTTPPVITIGDYVKTPVNTDITVTATTNEGRLNYASHTFTENGSFDFIATDSAGNVTTKTVSINNIDKVAPEITIGEYTKTPVNTDITVTATTNEGSLNSTSHTFTENGSFDFIATDAAGNVTTKTVSIDNIDKIAPEITIGEYTKTPVNTDITVTATTNEGSLNYASHTFTENGSFDFIATDAAGNVTTKTVSIDNIDKTLPTIFSPLDGMTFKLNEKVTADWAVTDANGVASEVGSVIKGEDIDTNTVGTKTFTVTAVDNAGNSITKTITYNVVYVFGGIKQPINNDNSSVFKLGSTVPVKFQLKDYYGNVVPTAASVMPTISISKVSSTVSGTVIETVLTDMAMTGNTFRFDASSQQYIFNLSTKGWTAGTYEIKITVKDCTVITPVKISSK